MSRFSRAESSTRGKTRLMYRSGHAVEAYLWETDVSLLPAVTKQHEKYSENHSVTIFFMRNAIQTTTTVVFDYEGLTKNRLEAEKLKMQGRCKKQSSKLHPLCHELRRMVKIRCGIVIVPSMKAGLVWANRIGRALLYLQEKCVASMIFLLRFQVASSLWKDIKPSCSYEKEKGGSLFSKWYFVAVRHDKGIGTRERCWRRFWLPERLHYNNPR